MPRIVWSLGLSLLLVLPSSLGAVLDERPDPVADYVDSYVELWKAFYPSRAVSQGFLDSIGGFEDRSTEAIDFWIEVNLACRGWLDALDEEDLTRDQRIDRRLLRTQVLKELDRWQNDRPHESSLALYSDLIARPWTPVVASPVLSRDEKRRLLPARLEAVRRLSAAARSSLRDGRPAATRQAIEKLDRSADRLADDLSALLEPDDALAGELRSSIDAAATAVTTLAEFARNDLFPRLTLPDEPILGRDVYAHKLAIYTDSDLTPERLEQMALGEIQASKRALAELSERYWRDAYPDEALPADPEGWIARGFADLEANRPTTEQEYLLELRKYSREVEEFVRDHEIATVPERNTLSVELAPESSGPMARIGFVRSAPSFHPNPWTTWYLATIPDSHPEQERVDFWRSFNYSFKRFIVIHELFPGHYMQLKLLRENPHPVRILFPYRPFIEGWATFTERIVLDAGYAEGDYLTRLAQLRKRLENANRAYMSVQAHCHGWTEDQVTDFSIETSLLAPQFAKSLWGRLMRSPMQILTYMLMGLELGEVYEGERARLGDRFVTREFMDTVLRTGPVPSDEIVGVLRAERP